MPSFQGLTTAQLKQAVQIREQIESLQGKLDALLGGSGATTMVPVSTKGKRKMSAAARAAISAAQKARWAKSNGTPAKTVSKKSAPTKTVTKSAPATASATKRTFSPETKAKLAAAMKARWAAKKKGAQGQS